MSSTKATGKKFGRNKRSCDLYTLQGRHLKNKRKRLTTHVKYHANDKQSQAALSKL